MIKQIAALSALMAAGVLAACAPVPEASRATEQSVDAVSDRAESILAITQRVIGDYDWTVETAWSPCAEDGERFVRHTLWAESAAVIDGDRMDLAQEVAESWKPLGLAARAENAPDTPDNVVVSDPPFLYGTDENGELTRLQIGPTFTSLQVSSACVPGNVLELNSRTSSP